VWLRCKFGGKSEKKNVEVKSGTGVAKNGEGGDSLEF
jgi:hypothetical protein